MSGFSTPVILRAGSMTSSPLMVFPGPEACAWPTGDNNGDGMTDIITGAAAGGGPHVRVFNGHDTDHVLREFMAYLPTDSFGIYVASGDVNGDGIDDIITSPGSGGGPHVKVFDGATGAIIKQWMAYNP